MLAFATPIRWAVVLAATALLGYGHTANASRSCSEWHAEFLSVEGTVEVQQAAQMDWIPAAQGDVLCTGDAVRVQSYSRATIRLPDQTMLRLNEHTTLAFSEPEDETASWLKLLLGAIHVISRDPRALKFFTPYANAGLEGTEFLIQVTEEVTEVAVLEGAVVVTNPSGQTAVPSGHVASARAAQAPVSRAIAEPAEYSRWAAYYPSIFDSELPAPDQAPTASQAVDANFYAARAARRLSYGRSDAAQADLVTALSLAPQSAIARAVQSVAALSNNDRSTALALAQAAVSLAPDSAIPLVALSYAQQANADLDEALASLRHAIGLEPMNATAWARLAEVELASGNFEGSLASATRAAALQPTLAHAQSVLGFANLTRLDTKRAVDAFHNAIELDQASPLPRLGLALALVQRGDLAAGREQLEIAVILDPGNALTRSYMAKTYAAENRSRLTLSQLQLAKRFDPTDPTPWFYGSLHQRNSNRPVEALRDLQTATDLNDNRAVYRSTLLVDEDLASRSAGVGRLHRELGFEDLALLQGWKSVAADPTDYSGHRLLADVYSTLPRHEIARVNSLFQSQMLQPINLAPIQPQLAEANLFILDEAGPSELAFGEFSPLLSKDGLRLQGSAVTGANNTVGEDLAIAGLHDRVSYSIGHFRFSTDGFRENNDLDQTVTNAFVQFRPNYGTSLQAELRSTETDSGHLLMLFDPMQFDPKLRQTEGVDSLRLGLRRDVSERGTVLAAVIYQDVHATADSGEAFSLRSTAEGYSADVQHIYRGDRWQITSGLTRVRQDRIDINRSIPSPFLPFEAETTTQDYAQSQTNGYVYANFAASNTVIVALGVSADSVGNFQSNKDLINPKLGVLWTPTAQTTVRAALFRTLQGGLTISQQNIQPRLEPTQVAGFNQFFYGTQGEEAVLGGVAIDHEINANLFTGVEVSRRELTIPLFAPFPPPPRVIEAEVGEDLQRAYLYWTPTTQISVSAEYRREQLRDELAFLGFSELHTRRLPIEARYYHSSGFSAGLRASYLHQDGSFERAFAPLGSATELREDQFWILDASFGYRLPNRRGVLSLNIDNLLDQDFRFQDVDPFNPSIAPERMAYFRFTLAFQ